MAWGDRYLGCGVASMMRRTLKVKLSTALSHGDFSAMQSWANSASLSHREIVLVASTLPFKQMFRSRFVAEVVCVSLELVSPLIEKYPTSSVALLCNTFSNILTTSRSQF